MCLCSGQPRFVKENFLRCMNPAKSVFSINFLNIKKLGTIRTYFCVDKIPKSNVQTNIFTWVVYNYVQAVSIKYIPNLHLFSYVKMFSNKYMKSKIKKQKSCRLIIFY